MQRLIRLTPAARTVSGRIRFARRHSVPMSCADGRLRPTLRHVTRTPIRITPRAVGSINGSTALPNPDLFKMRVLRWIAFLPAAAVVIVVAQVATGLAAQHLAWWTAAPLVLFFGGAIAVFVAQACQIAPDPRVSAGAVLALFLFFEAVSLIGSFDRLSMFETIIRIYTDLVIVIGCWIAIKADRESLPSGAVEPMTLADKGR